MSGVALCYSILLNHASNTSCDERHKKNWLKLPKAFLSMNLSLALSHVSKPTGPPDLFITLMKKGQDGLSLQGHKVARSQKK